MGKMCDSAENHLPLFSKGKEERALYRPQLVSAGVWLDAYGSGLPRRWMLRA